MPLFIIIALLIVVVDEVRRKSCLLLESLSASVAIKNCQSSSTTEERGGKILIIIRDHKNVNVFILTNSYHNIVTFLALCPRLCGCVGVFIKLHITAQSGPIILVILGQGGINDTCYENF